MMSAPGVESCDSDTVTEDTWLRSSMTALKETITSAVTMFVLPASRSTMMATLFRSCAPSSAVVDVIVEIVVKTSTTLAIVRLIRSRPCKIKLVQPEKQKTQST